MSSKYSFKFTPLTDPKKTVFMANVTFEPKCRNNRHIHHATAGGGQILLCVDGAVEKGIIYGVGTYQKGEVKNTTAFNEAYNMGLNV